jgi:hypothetical protein
MQAEVPTVHPDILIVVSTINLMCKYVHYKLRVGMYIISYV